MHSKHAATEVTASLTGNTLTTVTTTTITLPLTTAEVHSCLPDCPKKIELAEYAAAAVFSSPPFVVVLVKSAAADSADTEVPPATPLRKVTRLTMALRAELCDRFGWPLIQEFSSKKPATLEELNTLVTAFKERYILPYQAKESSVRVNTFIDQLIKRYIREFRRSILQAQKAVLRQAREKARLVEKRKRLARKQRRLAYLKAKALTNPRKVTGKNPALRMKLQYELETLERNVGTLGKLLQNGIGNEDKHYAKIFKYLAEIKVLRYRLN